MSDNTPIPLEKNPRALRLLEALEQGPKTTIDLHSYQLVHPARQIWELRHWYGFEVKTHRLTNRVALYELQTAA